MILESKSAKEIIGELWGTTGGDSYRKASAEYQAIVQQMIRCFIRAVCASLEIISRGEVQEAPRPG